MFSHMSVGVNNFSFPFITNCFLVEFILSCHFFLIGGFKDEVQLSITDGWVAEDV